MPQLAACRSAQVRGYRHALECRLRHRLTLLPWPYRQTLLSRLWREVLGEEFIMGISSSQWARNRRQPVVHVWFLSQRSVTARPAHLAEDWRRHALFMTTSWNEPSRMERARVALACAWMQLSKLRETARSHCCKYDVLCGGMKHSTT